MNTYTKKKITEENKDYGIGQLLVGMLVRGGSLYSLSLFLARILPALKLCMACVYCQNL